MIKIKTKIIFSLFISVILLICFTAIAFGAQYTYDELGRLKTADYSNGQKITYFYDAAGNITSVKNEIPPNVTPQPNPNSNSETNPDSSSNSKNPSKNNTGKGLLPITGTNIYWLIPIGSALLIVGAYLLCRKKAM